MKQFLAIVLTGTVGAASAQAFNFVSPGNLESPKPADCVPIRLLSSDQNPADIFSGFRKCVAENETRKAAALFFTAMIYGTYDLNRVADKSARQAIIVLQRDSIRGLSPQAASELEAARQSLKGDPGFCLSLKALGKPTYYPRYMVAHGVGVMDKAPSENGIFRDFQPEKQWQELLAIAKCSQ